MLEPSPKHGEPGTSKGHEGQQTVQTLHGYSQHHHYKYYKLSMTRVYRTLLTGTETSGGYGGGHVAETITATALAFFVVSPEDTVRYDLME